MGIADELITRGWTQGTAEDEEGRLCLIGAASRVSARNRTDVHDGWAALKNAIGVNSLGMVAAWNDAPERTYDEVLRAAKLADEELGL